MLLLPRREVDGAADVEVSRRSELEVDAAQLVDRILGVLHRLKDRAAILHYKEVPEADVGGGLLGGFDGPGA